MYTLGINAVYHDSSACLVHDGKLVAAAEEERFTGIKHGKRPIPFSTYELPFHAIDYCLKEAGINMSDIDRVAYSYDPDLFEEGLSPWDSLFLNQIRNAPDQLVDGVPHHLRRRFQGIQSHGSFDWTYVDHHLAHAASASLVSPFNETAVLTLDGRGEKATTTYNLGQGKNIHRLGQVNMPNSLGLLYEELTTYLGFLHSSDEYKVMALASYGKPLYEKEFRKIVQLEKNGQYTIAPHSLEEIFGPARQRGGSFEEKHFDIARSLQGVLEETVVELAHWLYQQTKSDSLCLAGGVALNCVMNARLRDKTPFKNIWVQPAAGDAGTALGAAMWADAQASNGAPRQFVMEHSYWGPSYSEQEIEKFLIYSKSPYKRVDDIPSYISNLLVQDRIVGWFQGRMEFGPRALGSRSIIASPLHAEMQAKLNQIKDREDFRPVAPVVMEEKSANWFANSRTSPFMLFVFDVLPGMNEKIPAVTHVDGTARIQTVNRSQNPLYYDLLKSFEQRTGVPILINTSFNTRGKPIVCSPRDAVECFWSSPLDVLAIGPFVLEKNP